MNRLTDKNFSFKCPMNWDAMQATDNGRFCGKCQKEVFDLTNCSLDEVRALQQKHGSICGSIRVMGAAAVAISLSTAACQKENQKPDSVRTVGEIQSPSQLVLPPEQRLMGDVCVLPPVEPEKKEAPKEQPPHVIKGFVCPIQPPAATPAPSKEILPTTPPLTISADNERVIAPSQSISAAIQNAQASGDLNPRFRLQAKRVGSMTDYEVRVRVATPAVTSNTTISVNGGESKYIDEDDIAIMLVSDEPDSAIVLISVEKKGGNVDGIIHKDGEKIKLTQKSGGITQALAVVAEDFIPPARSCGYDAKIERRSLFESGHGDDPGPCPKYPPAPSKE